MLPEADEQFFQHQTHHWLNLWKAKDRTQLELLLPDNFNYISKTRRNFRIDKQGWLKLAMEGYPLDDYEVSFVNITIHPHTAIVVTRATLYAMAGYIGMPDEFVLTDIWCLLNETWKPVARTTVHL
ncbi:MAG: nuclear transport factor 2 family protein [Chitinophagaceae bacterium]